MHVLNAVARLSKMVANRAVLDFFGYVVLRFTFDGVHNVFGDTGKAVFKLERTYLQVQPPHVFPM